MLDTKTPLNFAPLYNASLKENQIKKRALQLYFAVNDFQGIPIHD